MSLYILIILSINNYDWASIIDMGLNLIQKANATLLAFSNRIVKSGNFLILNKIKGLKLALPS